MAALGGNNDTGWEGCWCEPDEALRLERQRAQNESRTGRAVKWQHDTRSGVDWVVLTSHQIIRTPTHTHTHTRQVHSNKGNTGDLVFLKSCCFTGKLLLFLFPVQVSVYACRSETHRALFCTVFGSFSYVGWCYWKLSGSFLCERWCGAPGPGPAWSLVQHCSGLASATKWISLSNAAPDLLTHFLTQEIELTPLPLL